MFASRLTDYDIVDAAPYHKDPLKVLADACRREKIKLFFYYSLLDWHHPDYFPNGKTGQTAGRPANGDPKRYVAYYQGQIRELCTNYGAIGGIWFDGWWDKPDADWDLAGTYRMIHELQPGALVGNNHHVAPFPGEDFQMFEQDLPGENAAGFNTADVAAKLPLETCLTINQLVGIQRPRHAVSRAPSNSFMPCSVPRAGAPTCCLTSGRGRTGPSARNLPSGCKTSASGSPLTANRSTARAGARSRPRPGASRRPGDRPNILAKSILHVFKLKEGTSIVFDPRFAWTPYLFGKPEPLRLRQTKKSLVLDLPDEASMPIDTIITLTPKVMER